MSTLSTLMALKCSSTPASWGGGDRFEAAGIALQVWPLTGLAQVQEPGSACGETGGGKALGKMTTLTMRYMPGHFVVGAPDIEPVMFKSRREARDWCAEHHPSSPIR
jgi:hypothetical protein